MSFKKIYGHFLECLLLLPFALLIVAIFRSGTLEISVISLFLSSFNFPMFYNPLLDAIQTISSTTELSPMILSLLSVLSWELFVLVASVIVLLPIWLLSLAFKGMDKRGFK